MPERLGEMMPDNRSPSEPVGAKYDVTVHEGVVGSIGDSATVTMNVVTPRRPITWPQRIGLPPPLASAFQSRSDLSHIILESSTVALRSVMSGGGGVGKSQLAAKIFEDSRVDLRVWIQGESRAGVLSGYSEAAVRLNLADPNDGQETQAERFLTFLATSDKSWLIVVDNLGDPADMKRLWPPGEGRLIVTTRRRDAALSGGGRSLIDVGVYTEAEAENYLRQRLTPSLKQLPLGALDEAAQVGADLGFLPLGLAHAAALIIDQALTCGGYRRILSDRKRAMEGLFTDADSDGYDLTVATTWTLAIEAADRLDPSGFARPLADLVAACEATGVPETLFTTHSAREFLAAKLGVESVTVEEARGGLRALHRLSLINHDPNPSNPRAVRMHNLTARGMLQRLDEADRQRVVSVLAASLAEIWPEVDNDPAFSESLIATVYHLRNAAPTVLWHSQMGVHPILFHAGQSLSGAGMIREAVAYWTELESECRDHLGGDHPDTLTSQHNLALAYYDAGDRPTAIRLFEAVIAARESLLEPDHPNTLKSRNSLACAYQDAGDLARAIPLFERTLLARERTLGTDHRDTLRSRDNLACAIANNGDLVRAIPLHEQSYADHLRILGRQDRETLRAWNNLAFAYDMAGDHAHANMLYQQILVAFERLLGHEHPNTLASRHNLASSYQDLEDFAQAIRLHEQNLADRVRVLGIDHPKTRQSRDALASTRRKARRREGEKASE